MKNKAFKVLAMVMVAGTLLTGCGGPSTPSGTYEKSGFSFNFDKDTVIVTEGENSLSCDYEMDEEGNISFELRGTQYTCKYDAENDVINFWGEQYTK
ncbi:MAG: hypothetical protein J6A59_08185 [Lachnospiraceae bacterium]|nr:hypothetical protein [Lachnospiraceae bacterium]